MLSISKTLMLASGALALSLTTAACSSDCEGDFCAEGSVSALTGAEVPAAAKTIVVWSVATAAPEQGYKYGAGTSTSETFVVSFDEDPPDAAISEDGIGVGFMALVAEDAEVPDGTFDATTAATLLGISPKHAVIYKSADAAGLEWSTDFSEGYSCGICVEGEDGDLDTFNAADCGDATIEVSETAPALDVCTWM